MKPILAASLVSCLALAGPAGAQSRCDLDGQSGPEVLVRYPHDHDIHMRHVFDHIPWGVAPGPVAVQGLAIGTHDPRVIGVGDFIPGGGCDLLWEEEEPHVGLHEQPIRVAVTEGLTAAGPGDFDWAIPRPPLPWDVAGVLDLTDDGLADVLWWHPGTGSVMLWVRNAHGWTEAPVDGALSPTDGAEPPRPRTAIVRFEPENPPGIVWRPTVQESLDYRYLQTSWNGHKLTLQDAGIVQGLDATGFSIVAVGDFDGDGHDDVLQQNDADTTLRVCFMNGRVLRACSRLFPRTLEISGPGYVGWFVAGPR